LPLVSDPPVANKPNSPNLKVYFAANMYFTYTFCLFVGLLVSSPWYLIRSRRYFATLKSRFGYLNIPDLKRSIWVHAVSVGEVRAVGKLLESLRRQYPGQPLVLSTITPTGQQLARETAGLADHVFYFPFDFPGSIRRTLAKIDPALVIIAETEIWPNSSKVPAPKDQSDDGQWPDFGPFVSPLSMDSPVAEDRTQRLFGNGHADGSGSRAHRISWSQSGESAGIRQS
jgi:hypothetical protein